MSVLGYITGADVLVTGVERAGDEFRVYFGNRSDWRYVVIDDAELQAKFTRMWGTGGHLTMPRPPAEFVFVEKPSSTPEGSHHAA